MAVLYLLLSSAESAIGTPALATQPVESQLATTAQEA
jgi:hypothetical protein